MKEFFFFLLAATAFAQTTRETVPTARKQPLVLISGNGNITISGGAVQARIVATGNESVSKHDQTIEMAQQLLKHCPEITLTVSDEAESKPDYELLLNREGFGFFDSGDSQIMLVRGSDKIVLWAIKKGTVSKAVKEGCKAILSDWRAHSAASADWWNQTAAKSLPKK